MKKPKRKKFRQETVIHSYIHRPLSLEIVRLLWNTNITANQITLFRVFFIMISLLYFTQGTMSGFIIGFVLFQINEILDHVDGMYSRYKKQSSKIGAFMEYTFDDLFAGSQGLLGFSIALGAYNATNNLIYIWLFISMTIGYGLSLVYIITFEKDKLCKDESFKNIAHDEEEYKQIIGIPLKKSCKNIIFTIYIWRNEVLVWGALFYFIGLDYGIDLILIALVFHSIIYNLQWIKKVFIAFEKAKNMDKI